MKKKSMPQNLPDELYVSFVRSLYSNKWVQVFGFIAQSLIALAIYESSDNKVFAFFAAFFVLIGAIRLLTTFRFEKAALSETGVQQARKWETYYMALGSAVAVAIGFMSYIALHIQDTFPALASMTLIMATMVTIVGKNFASKRLVLMLVTSLSLPVFAAYADIGGWKYWTGALLLVLFALSVISMSKYVRDFLKDAVLANIENKSIANRFDVAINNMPHGLIMFDRDLRAIVVNCQALKMIQAPVNARILGRRLAVILRFCRFKGLFGTESLYAIETRIQKMLSGQDDRKFLLSSSHGMHLEFSAGQISSGGGVLIFEDVSERLENESKIQRMARFDSLTGLPNRVHFRELSRSILASQSASQFCAFVAVDLDDFKHVNDSLGHPVGDELLCRVADRFNLVANDKSLFSRFGGDEFVGIISGYNTPQAAIDAANRAIAALSGHYDIAGHALIITVSAGIVAFAANEYELNGLMIRSDLALYESKSKGKGVTTVFAREMDDRYQRRQRLKNDLKQAIRSNSLKVFYQPIIDVHTMRISACEALCRWDHPEFGPISPAIFIPIAEETGAISDLTRFMLETATMDCAGWEGNVSVAVNLSAIDFRSPNLEDMVRVALGKSRLEPHRLEVEVTEGAILDDQESACQTLDRLKASGVKIALDDFGTGYSSLSYLHKLPLDKVKIDQTFVRDIVANERSVKLVSGVTHLANELGLKITIEGIETLEQFERLRDRAHIDLAQGFLFGAALSSRGISTLIASSHAISRHQQKLSAKVA